MNKSILFSINYLCLIQALFGFTINIEFKLVKKNNGTNLDELLESLKNLTFETRFNSILEKKLEFNSTFKSNLGTSTLSNNKNVSSANIRNTTLSSIKPVLTTKLMLNSTSTFYANTSNVNLTNNTDFGSNSSTSPVQYNTTRVFISNSTLPNNITYTTKFFNSTSSEYRPTTKNLTSSVTGNMTTVKIQIQTKNKTETTASQIFKKPSNTSFNSTYFNNTTFKATRIFNTTTTSTFLPINSTSKSNRSYSSSTMVHPISRILTINLTNATSTFSYKNYTKTTTLKQTSSTRKELINNTTAFTNKVLNKTTTYIYFNKTITSILNLTTTVATTTKTESSTTTTLKTLSSLEPNNTDIDLIDACSSNSGNYCLNDGECYLKYIKTDSSSVILDRFQASFQSNSLSFIPKCKCRSKYIVYHLIIVNHSGDRCETKSYSFTYLSLILIGVITILFIALLILMTTILRIIFRNRKTHTSNQSYICEYKNQVYAPDNRILSRTIYDKEDWLKKFATFKKNSWRYVKMMNFNNPNRSLRRSCFFKRFQDETIKRFRRPVFYQRHFLQKRTASSDIFDMNENFIFVDRHMNLSTAQLFGGTSRYFEDMCPNLSPSVPTLTKLDAKCSSNIFVYPKPSCSSSSINQFSSVNPEHESDLFY